MEEVLLKNKNLRKVLQQEGLKIWYLLFTSLLQTKDIKIYKY